jgi:hypothetical protein
MATKTAKYEFEATVTTHGDIAIEEVKLLMRNGSYTIHKCEFPSSYLGDADIGQYTDSMLHSVVRMAGVMLRKHGVVADD